MKHAKFGENYLVELTSEEIRIIDNALNNRMVKLAKMRKKEIWAEKEWYKCLDLQCEWFNIK